LVGTESPSFNLDFLKKLASDKLGWPEFCSYSKRVLASVLLENKINRSLEHPTVLYTIIQYYLVLVLEYSDRVESPSLLSSLQPTAVVPYSIKKYNNEESQYNHILLQNKTPRPETHASCAIRIKTQKSGEDAALR
jgi:hypothetical protein